MQAAINAARGEIQRISKIYKRQGWDVALGTSGSAKSIANVIIAQGLGQGITLDAMRQLANRIIEAGSVKKAKLDGLKPERVEVFAGGLAVLQAAFEELDIAEMQFTEAALRDGVFYDMIGRNLEEDLRDQTTAQFQQRYHVSTNQAERVAKLAGYFLYNLAQNGNRARIGLLVRLCALGGIVARNRHRHRPHGIPQTHGIHFGASRYARLFALRANFVVRTHAGASWRFEKNGRFSQPRTHVVAFHFGVATCRAVLPRPLAVGIATAHGVARKKCRRICAKNFAKLVG